MKASPVLTQKIVRTLLRYDRKTGEFYWRRRPDGRACWNTRYAGKKAGYRWNDGKSKITYWVIRIFDYPFLAYRIAWLYVTGEWPICVDHRDLDGENNKWRNLRAASKTQNGANRGCNSNNKTGFKGVSLNKATGRFRATIQFDGRWRQIGIFDKPEEAHRAYQKEATRLAGKFARAA